MKNINDDLLNRFLDNELSSEEKNLVKNEIEKSDSLKKRYEALLITHSLLKNIQPDSTSLDFGKMVMQKISKRGVVESQQKKLLLLVVSFLGVIILGIVGYLFYQIFNTIHLSETNNAISTYSNTIRDYFSVLFGKKNLSVLGSVLSFIMLVSGYFLYDYRKHSKKNFSH
jgi:hypothetical protein